jgi:hypothetical protein
MSNTVLLMKLWQISEDEYHVGQLEAQLERLAPQLADAANQACDGFDWSQVGPDSGACGDVAEAMLKVIQTKLSQIIPDMRHQFISVTDDEIWESEHHTALRVTSRDETIIVDVPAFVYERWNEEKEIWERIGRITPKDVVIEQESSF